MKLRKVNKKSVRRRSEIWKARDEGGGGWQWEVSSGGSKSGG